MTDLFLSCFSSFLVGFLGSFSGQSSVGVESIQSFGVVKRVVLLLEVGGAVSFSLSDCRLDFVGVDDS